MEPVKTTAVFQTVDPSLRAYFKKHSIPDIYEALLCGLLAMRPDDPLGFLEEKLKEVMEKGLYSILWDTCIDPDLSLKLKAISDTYLHTLLGLDDDQLMTEDLCDRAWDFYSINLKRMCFDAWIEYCSMRKISREIFLRKMAIAKHFYEQKLLKLKLQQWSNWVKLRDEQNKTAANKIGKVFECSLQMIVLKAWRKQTGFTKKAKKYSEQLVEDTEDFLTVDYHGEKREKHEKHEKLEKQDKEKSHPLRHPREEYISAPPVRSGRDNMAKLPERAVAQIFHYLTIIDLARCAQVSRNWKAMTQMGSVWSNINFSAVKDKIKDNIAGNILLKWHTNVLNLNLRGCATLYWFTFKNIAHCKNLQDLNVTECQGLNDELIRLVTESCPAILYLNLSHTDITNGTLRLLSRGCPNLQYLSLAYCRKFTDNGLLYLGSERGCRKLIYLDLSGCLQLTVEGFRNIADSCSSIKHLIINEMPTLSDRCIQALAEKCHQIVSVEFNESPHVSDAAFKALAKCKLVKMKIQGSNRITDLTFKLISNSWPHMKHICVGDCQKITDLSLKMIAPLPDIVILNLSDCIRVSDGGLKAFTDGASGSNIRELSLANCSYITDSAITKIAQRCHNLIYLNLRYCQSVTDAGIDALTQISSLAYINISGINVTDQALDALGKIWKIKEIIISECRLLTDAGIKRFCLDLRRLDHVDLSYNQQLTNNSLKHLSFNCHRITILSVTGCPKVTDTGIQFVAAECPFLHYLDISGCMCITDRALKCLWKGCHQLRILKMLYCPNITRQAVSKFAPKLQKYEYNNEDPPPWFGYDTKDDTPTPKKHKKYRPSLEPRPSIEPSIESSTPSIVSPSAEKSVEFSIPPQ
ncbi:F-box and leucine-rich repeat protein 13 isoform X1 [Zootoca vivipara]|uniref:F-box and leucine-rich repeat protein 13 isoform X1 n=1 Tax=Zootoca vivipara TaxID=8524 RepID=UPI00158FDA75|nr:F-box and leucine-rich repeat protein 13 isoform X1 [Zootoca vivipara]